MKVKELVEKKLDGMGCLKHKWISDIRITQKGNAYEVRNKDNEVSFFITEDGYQQFQEECDEINEKEGYKKGLKKALEICSNRINSILLDKYKTYMGKELDECNSFRKLLEEELDKY